MRFDLLHPADQLVMMMNRIYYGGMTTTSGGNLSIRDLNGDIWITPTSVDKGSLTRADICCVHPDGSCEGPHQPSVELPFHQHIYAIRPDIQAIVHAHPPALVGFSLARRIPEVNLLPHVRLVCGNVAMAKYDVPGSVKLGENIAEKFAEGNDTIILENHGVVVGKGDMYRAFMAFETLEFCARLQVDATVLGKLRLLTREQLALTASKISAPMNAFVPSAASSQECAARRDMCAFIHRAYKQQLFSSTQGTFSQRLSDRSFLITPYRMDRAYLEPEDLVLIQGEQCEAGKTPSRSVGLHRAIYDRHKDIGSVLIAHPPAIMAFAVTEAAFDSRTIPESYIMLRNVQRIPFGKSFVDVEGTAELFSPSTPVLLVENDCVIVTGSTLLKAFDRLEVAEYSAKALIHTRSIGPVVAINDQEVQQIEKAFHLE